jgi:hypothetical protein
VRIASFCHFEDWVFALTGRAFLWNVRAEPLLALISPRGVGYVTKGPAQHPPVERGFSFGPAAALIGGRPVAGPGQKILARIGLPCSRQGARLSCFRP